MARSDHAPEGPVEADVFSRMCASREVFQHVTGRWGALVVVALDGGDTAMRFGELRRRVDGISDRMLSQTLTQLERDGIVVRSVRSAIPPHVEYALTPLGRDVAEPLATLVSTIEDQLGRVLQARTAYGEDASARE